MPMTPFGEYVQAIETGDTDLAARILDQGLDPNYTAADGNTPLSMAVRYEREGIVKRLVDMGADARVESNGCSVLYWAALRRNWGIVEHLLRAGAPPSLGAPLGGTALQEAAVAGDIRAAQLLLRAGADINQQQRTGWSALHLAIDKKRRAMVEFLLSRRADATLVHRSGCTTMHLLSSAGYVDLAEKVLAQGVPVDAVDSHGHTPMHLAIKHGRLDRI